MCTGSLVLGFEGLYSEQSRDEGSICLLLHHDYPYALVTLLPEYEASE